MTAKKQIEEMADFLFNEAENYCDPDGHIITNKLAEALYNAGYRKTIWHKVADAEYEDLEEQGLLVRLPCKAGDEVVISKEEYEKLKSFVHKEDVYKIMKEELYKTVEDITKELWKKVRKETAKKILQEIASLFYSISDSYELTLHDMQELAKKYGVEVEE